MLIVPLSVDGCSDALLPARAVTSRNGDDVAIICNESLEIFYVTCQGSSWVGEMGNCSKIGVILIISLSIRTIFTTDFTLQSL